MHSGNRHRIHSPYLYRLVCEVIRNGRASGELKAVEEIRKECRRSHEVIMKTDYGDGNNHSGNNSYPVKIRRLALTSLTSPAHARRLFRMVRFIKAERILEIGTSLGITTAYLALANPGARIITLEGCPQLCLKAREHFSRLGIRNVEVIEGRFEVTLSQALDRLGHADLIYVDGNHRKEAMLDYYQKCLAYSFNNSVMIFDDIHAHMGMEEAWEQIRQQEEVRISLDLFFSGWIFFRKESSKQHFRLRYF